MPCLRFANVGLTVRWFSSIYNCVARGAPWLWLTLTSTSVVIGGRPSQRWWQSTSSLNGNEQSIRRRMRPSCLNQYRIRPWPSPTDLVDHQCEFNKPSRRRRREWWLAIKKRKGRKCQGMRDINPAQSAHHQTTTGLFDYRRQKRLNFFPLRGISRVGRVFRIFVKTQSFIKRHCWRWRYPSSWRWWRHIVIHLDKTFWQQRSVRKSPKWWLSNRLHSLGQYSQSSNNNNRLKKKISKFP